MTCNTDITLLYIYLVFRFTESCQVSDYHSSWAQRPLNVPVYYFQKVRVSMCCMSVRDRRKYNTPGDTESTNKDRGGRELKYKNKIVHSSVWRHSSIFLYCCKILFFYRDDVALINELCCKHYNNHITK